MNAKRNTGEKSRLHLRAHLGLENNIQRKKHSIKNEVFDAEIFLLVVNFNIIFNGYPRQRHRAGE